MELRGPKKCLEIISAFIQHLMTSTDSEKDAYRLFYDFVNKKFGFDSSVIKYYENYLYSFKLNLSKDSRIDLCCKFIGLGEGCLPRSVFKHYLSLIELSGYNIQDIYSSEVLKFQVSFFTLNSFLKRVLAKREREIYKVCYESIKRHWIVKTDIALIKKNFDLDLFQIYK